jgi:cation diffusion facilitator family transporter
LSVAELYRLSRRAAFWGSVLNLGLGITKLLGGWLGHSIALVSDSVQSLGDALTSGAIVGALILSQRPPNPAHPYGYTRAETVAGSSTALLLMLSALWIAWEALHTLSQDYQQPETYTLVIAAAGAILKEGLYQYNIRVARRTGSSALVASAWDHRLDALNSLIVVAGVALAKWGGPAWHWADHVAALMVAATVFWVGASLFWSNLHELMDRQADPHLVQQVRREALDVPGVRGIEKLLVRKTGLEYLVDMHVEVDPLMTVQDSHAIAHAVKDQVMRRVILIKDVLVHVEPWKRGQGSEVRGKTRTAP